MNTPYILIITRLFLAPIIIFVSYHLENSGRFIVSLMTLGLLTDIFDGVIARYLKQSTEKMRRFDSQTDLIFWLAIGYSAWLLHADVLRKHLPSILIIFAMEGLCYAISILKFKRETCTHAYLSKLFGLALFIAFFNLLAFGAGDWSIVFAIIVGFLSHLDRILITLILPEWTFDVPSFYHAFQIRKGKRIKRFKLFN